MNNVSWRGVRAFLQVAEHGSFTAAANASGASKANLSQLVTELEASLGVQLLYRTTRQLRLTEVGEGYHARCRQAVDQLDAAAEWAVQCRDEVKGPIRLNAVGGAIGEDLIAPLVIDFQRRHPGVSVDLDFSSVRVDLIDRHYDLVVRMGTLPDSTLIARKLHTIATRYVASPAFVDAHGPVRRPEDLTGLPLICGSVDRWVLARGDERRTVHVHDGIKVSSGRVMRRAAVAGLGVTRVADIYAQSDIDRGTLVDVLPDWSEETPLWLVCPPLRHQLARVKALMDWLGDRFEPLYRRALRGEPGA